jgi:hypothetical protein
MNPLRALTIAAVVFSFVGLGLIIVGAFQFFEVRAFVRTAAVADGRVVKLELSRFPGRSRHGYVTVFTFLDASGQAHTARTLARNPASHNVGAKVEVLYQPEAPESARIRAFRMLWLIPTVLISLGLTFSGVGPFIFLKARSIYGCNDEDAA